MPKPKLHQLHQSGATAGQAPLWDPDAVDGLGEWAAGDVVKGLTSADSSVTVTDNGDGTLDLAASGGGGAVESVVPGTGISVDDTDPANPIVSATGGGGGGGGYQPGSADEPPTAPNAKDDEFDAASSVTWTATPTAPNATDINTTRPNHLYIKANGSGAAYVGLYQPVPGAYPYTIITKISSTARANYQRGGGIILAPAAPVSTSTILYAGTLFNAGVRVAERISAQFGGTYVSQTAAALSNYWGPIYMKVVVNSATSVSTYASTDGWAWLPVELNFNPGFTPAFMGLAMNDETAGSGVEAFFDFFRVT